jgi:hypothetical protein
VNDKSPIFKASCQRLADFYSELDVEALLKNANIKMLLSLPDDSSRYTFGSGVPELARR